MLPPLGPDGLPEGWPQDHGICTLGIGVIIWAETELAQPDGDLAGQPWQFRPSQARMIAWWYAVDGDGRFLFRRGQIVLPKGSGKSPIAAALSCAELAGPVVFDRFDDSEPGGAIGRPHPSPLVQLAAVSQDQTDNTMSLVLSMLREGPASRHIAGLDTGITRVLTRMGKLQPVTASAASREGARLTAAILDEALALDTPLPTPSGWTTMEKVQPGDWLYGSDGQQVQVVKTTEVQNDRDCFRVTFADGTSVVTSDGHLWAARPVKARASAMREWTTGEMAAKGGRFRVPLAASLAGARRDLPVDPYCLGAWLGDGSTGQQYITAAEEDAEEMAAQLRAVGFLGVVNRPRDRACRISLSNRAGFQGANRTPAAQALYALPCFRDKRIPEEYLLADREQRTALLQGLMDTDGHIGKDGYCTFVGTSQLADGVIRLLRGLGQVPMRHWVTDERSRHGGYVKVHFVPRGELEPFRLARKAERVRQSPESGVTVVSIEPVASVPVKCVAVGSDDHLFAIGDGHVLTHNTHLWTKSNGGHRLATTIRRNLGKMDGRSIETTNTWVAGELSVAENSAKYADLVAEGEFGQLDESILRWHPQAGVEDLGDEPALRAGLEHLYGDYPWVNIDRIIAEIYDLGTPPAEARRFYLNQVSSEDDAWVTQYEWAARADATKVVADRDAITLGFDGSRHRSRGVTDATALVGCRVSDGHLFTIRVWEQPDNDREWQVPTVEVEAELAATFQRYNVVGFYADSALWETFVATWEAKYGAKLRIKASREHPIEWRMNRPLAVVQATEKLYSAIVDGEMTHDGTSVLTRHVLNARRRSSRSGVQIAKSSPDSPNKIDAAVTAVLAWQARLDAVAAGLGTPRRKSVIPRRLDARV